MYCTDIYIHTYIQSRSRFVYVSSRLRLRLVWSFLLSFRRCRALETIKEEEKKFAIEGDFFFFFSLEIGKEKKERKKRKLKYIT